MAGRPKKRVSDTEENPWERVHVFEGDIRTTTDPDKIRAIELAIKRPRFQTYHHNVYLDIDTKLAALKASPCVVSLVSFSGEVQIVRGSGTIIEADDQNRGIVLTSANLIRRPPTTEDEFIMENILADNLRVVVYLYDGKSYEGEICTYDFHYNLAVIRFQSNSSLTAATLRPLDDSISIDPSHDFQLRPHSSSFNLRPGDKVIALGRYFTDPFDLMAAPGQFRLDPCEWDCKELFMVTCSTTRVGDGGPLINLSGEVIGFTFYDYGLRPCMPLNIAYKWWEHYKKYGEHRRPSLGIEATNLYVADLDVMEKIIHKFPGVCKGVLVEKVIQGSSADIAGLHQDDVIIQCDGQRFQSFLEFFEIMWDKVGSLVELVVVRPNQGKLLHLKMVVAEATSDKFNSWPRRDYR